MHGGNPPAHFDAVHLRHYQIHQNAIEFLIRQPAEPLPCPLAAVSTS